MADVEDTSDDDLTEAQREILSQLITGAFQRARERGKPNWTIMTTAVLKNRLLTATDGEFDEAEYGGRRLVDLLLSFPALVEVDTTTRPATVHWLPDGHTGRAPGSLLERHRLRSDLWNAVFDYSSAGAYVWREGTARLVSSAFEGELLLPTLDVTELDSWRSEFAQFHGDTPELREWAKGRLGTTALPPDLRPAWNRKQTEAAVSRLEAWFMQKGIDPPSDLTVDPARGRDLEEEALRSYLQRCIAAMSHEELKAVRIPANLAARLAR